MGRHPKCLAGIISRDYPDPVFSAYGVRGAATLSAGEPGVSSCYRQTLAPLSQSHAEAVWTTLTTLRGMGPQPQNQPTGCGPTEIAECEGESTPVQGHF